MSIEILRNRFWHAAKLRREIVSLMLPEVEAALAECEAFQAGFTAEREMRQRAEAGIVASERRCRCQTEELEQALQGMLDWYEDDNGAGFCECDKSVDLVCRACVARAALAPKGEGEKEND